MESLYAAGLGILQGLTEFLPVSSSGHLVLASNLLGLPQGEILFELVLHAATLLATLTYYRQDIRQILCDTYPAMHAVSQKQPWPQVRANHPGAYLLFWVALGSVPTAFIGLVFKDPLQALFSQPQTVAMMLWVTATVLLATAWLKPGTRTFTDLRWQDALWLGAIQGCAIVPGISRSGTTIALALALGCTRPLAAKLSFLLSIPAIVGAVLLEVISQPATNTPDIAGLSIGFLAAAITGFLALGLLVPLIRKGGLPWFAAYLIPAGALALWGL